MSEASFDLIVIGGGPAGYVASIRAAQLGMNVACVDKRETLGGTCLNVGCIPSKALLNASEKYQDAASGKLDSLGVSVGTVKLDLKAMMAAKEKIVSGLTGGIDHLFKKNKITRLTGSAMLKGGGVVEVISSKKVTSYSAAKILIATGSEPTSLPNIEINEKQIVSSTGALDLKKVPKSLVVIGAGYIGLEMGTVWARLGSKVEVIEYLPRILPGMDLEVANKFKAMMTKQGLAFHLGMAVKSAKADKSGVVLTIADAKTNEEKTLKCDVALVAVGRRANTDGLGLEALGVEMSERGQIKVDKDFETNIEGIFAVGDVIPGPMLAHKAEEDAVAAVEIMAGQSGHVDYELVPGIVYTAPEIATIGASEEALKEKNIAYNKGVFPFLANSRAKATGHIDGFVKILADAETDRVLGCHIIAHEAGTLIHEIAAVMAFGGSAEDIARTCHGHPTMNEAVKEAALAVDGRAIHI